MPWTIHTNTQIYYNDKLLKDNGIDGASLKTWADYLAAFDKLKAAGVTPIAFANKFGWSGAQWFFDFLVREVGVDPVLDLCARVGDRKWTDPDIVAAAQLYVDLSDKEYFSAGKASDDFPAAEALFFAGRAGFFQTGSWFIGDAQAGAPPDFQLGLNTFPTIEGGKGDPKQIVMQGLEGISISKKGAEANRDAALAFIDFLTQVPQAEDWVKDAVSISPVVGAVNEQTASPEPDENRQRANRWQHRFVPIPRAHHAQGRRRRGDLDGQRRGFDRRSDGPNLDGECREGCGERAANVHSLIPSP